jgi:hypothetical protein
MCKYSNENFLSIFDRNTTFILLLIFETFVCPQKENLTPKVDFKVKVLKAFLAVLTVLKALFPPPQERVFV